MVDGFVVRVTAYHGEPKLVGNVVSRSGVSIDVLVDEPHRQPVDVEVDGLISIFERSHQCKVNFGDEVDSEKDGVKVYEFDVFEPSHSDVAAAMVTLKELADVMVGWSRGLKLV